MSVIERGVCIKDILACVLGRGVVLSKKQLRIINICVVFQPNKITGSVTRYSCKN